MAITITKQPVSRTLLIYETVVFNVAAEGDGLTYQWEYSTNGGAKWDNNTLSGNATDTLSFTVKTYHNGYLYRCKITDSTGAVVRTNEVKLTAVAAMPDRGLIAYDTLTAIADAIRAKTETTDRMLPEEMAALIEGIKSGNPEFMTEGEYVAFRNTSSIGVSKAQIPCSMSEKPTRMVIRCDNSGTNYIKYAVYYDGKWMIEPTQSSIPTSTNVLILSNGFLCINAFSGLNFYPNYINHIYMWR